MFKTKRIEELERRLDHIEKQHEKIVVGLNQQLVILGQLQGMLNHIQGGLVVEFEPDMDLTKKMN